MLKLELKVEEYNLQLNSVILSQTKGLLFDKSADCNLPVFEVKYACKDCMLMCNCRLTF